MLNPIVYVLAFAAALSVVATCLEHLAVLRRQPRRTAWALAIICSALLPPLMVLQASLEQTATPVTAGVALTPATATIDAASTLPALQKNPVSSAIAAPETLASDLSSVWQVPLPSRSALLTGWAVASGALLAFLTGTGLLLWRRSANWQRTVIQGREALVSEDDGPALIGALRPRIVVPRWFMDEPADTQSLILEHEQQHIAAHDPLLLRVAMLIVIAAPWNLPLWWQLRRLRLAIELDCDARVMRGGANAGRYGQVLLGVTQRAVAMPVGVVAMSEPVSALEKRILNLAPAPGRCAVLRMVSALLIATAGVGAAAALEAPAVRTPAATPAATRPAATPDDTGPAAAATQSSAQPAPAPASPAAAERRLSQPDPTAVRLAFAMDSVIDDRENADGTPFDPLTFGKPICRVTRDGGPALANAAGLPGNQEALAALAKRCRPLNVFGTQPPTDASAPASTGTIGRVDLNVIPSDLLRRMDVVTGGASATYGSGAVAGVVNQVLNNRLKGFQLDERPWSPATASAIPAVSATVVAAAQAAQRAPQPADESPAGTEARSALPAQPATSAAHVMDLRDLIVLAGKKFQKSFVVDPRVKGTVDLGNLTAESLSYHAFLVILGVNGFAAVPSGDVVTIIPEVSARSVASPIFRADNIQGDDAEFVTVLLSVNDPASMATTVRTLVGLAGVVLPMPDGKTMLVFDKAGNVKRIIAVVQAASKPQ